MTQDVAKEIKREGASNYVGVRPVGGLGNQLFIYAAGLGLAQRTGARLVIRVDWYDRNGDRDFELAALPLNAEVTRLPWALDRTFRGRLLPEKARRALARSRDVDLLVERGHGYDRKFARSTPPIELRGYFQSWRYFTNVADELAAQLLALPASLATAELLNSGLLPEEPWIAVHVRGGDFLSPELRHLHGTTSVEYYERAVGLACELLGECQVVVFSDDPAEAAARLRGLSRDIRLIDLGPHTSPFDSLILMSYADAVVTANSSFSWWGAWLAERRGAKHVICPRPWFADSSLDENDLLPLSWLSLGRDYF